MDKLVNDRKKKMEKLPEDHLPLSLLDVFDPMYNIITISLLLLCPLCCYLWNNEWKVFLYIHINKSMNKTLFMNRKKSFTLSVW
jgi:hypothetical protein